MNNMETSIKFGCVGGGSWDNKDNLVVVPRWHVVGVVGGDLRQLRGDRPVNPGRGVIDGLSRSYVYVWSIYYKLISLYFKSYQC